MIIEHKDATRLTFSAQSRSSAINITLLLKFLNKNYSYVNQFFSLIRKEILHVTLLVYFFDE